MERLIDRVIRSFYFILAMILRHLIPIKNNRIICWSYNFNKYSCNPKEITKYLIKNHSDEYDIYWAFKKNIDINCVDSDVKVVRKNSLSYIWALYSSKYIFSNMRNDQMDSYFVKKKGQKYIMTWHASMSLKKVEKDAVDSVGPVYVKRAKKDSANCDLMLSGCKFHTDLFRNSFWYSGKILEKGTPRCDMLFNNKKNIREEICDKYNIDETSKIILYAPTFRQDYSLDVYKLDWDDVIDALAKCTAANYIVLLRLHPNFLSLNKDVLAQYQRNNVINVTLYPDMQELLLASDYLITDYSSSMFDFSLVHKPCFLYAVDCDSYDRGFYMQLHELPFPLAKDNESLIRNLLDFDQTSYFEKIDRFYNDRIVNYESGIACKALYEWMKKNKNG